MESPQRDLPTHINDTVRSGEYFNHARKWYFILFSNPIAERTFYFVAFCIALATLVLSFLAVVYILPTKEIFPFYVRNNDTDDKIPKIVKLRESTAETQDYALMRHFVKTYVIYRESYALDTFDVSAKLIANYSDQASLQSYQQLMDVANPSSPKLLFSDPWMRRGVDNVTVQLNLESQPYQAISVKFNTAVMGNNNGEVIPYTADVRFMYSPLQALNELDSVTGAMVMRFQQPEFQVVGYSVSQSGVAGVR